MEATYITRWNSGIILRSTCQFEPSEGIAYDHPKFNPLPNDYIIDYWLELIDGETILGSDFFFGDDLDEEEDEDDEEEEDEDL